jgi:hypothetical protein
VRSKVLQLVAASFLAVLSLGASAAFTPSAGASTAPYSLAFGGCVAIYLPFGFPPSPFPPYTSDFIEIRAYNLPPSANGIQGPSLVNTWFRIASGNQGLDPSAGVNNEGAIAENGVYSAQALQPGPGPFRVQVSYRAADDSIVRLPIVTVNVPDPSSCGSANVTSIGNPPGAVPAPVVATASTPTGNGYWMVGSDGQVYAFGDAFNLTAPGTEAIGPPTLNQPIVGMAATPDGKGYWLVAADGGVFTYGDAGFFGSTGAIRLNKPIVGMARTPDGLGYWLVASDGGVFAFGDAAFYGSMGGSHLNKPVVGMAVDQSTGGYWLVASDGGIFSFNAPFEGSTGSMHLNPPIVGMEAAPDGSGYRFVASDGGVFCFNEPFSGSTGSMHLNQPIVGMAATGSGGYWLAARDGGIFSFDAPFYGSTG